MPVGLTAGLWGLFAGGALVVGAAIAWFVPVPKKVVASIMAFGAGVLISALASDLVLAAVLLDHRDGAVGTSGAPTTKTPRPEARARRLRRDGIVSINNALDLPGGVFA